MRIANLTQADLSGADLSQADLTGTSLQLANLSSANLVGTIGLSGSRALYGGEPDRGQAAWD